MSEPEKTVVCEHGQLQRSCEICELTAERDEWKQRAEKAEGKVAAALRRADEYYSDWEAAEQTIATLRECVEWYADRRNWDGPWTCEDEPDMYDSEDGGARARECLDALQRE